MKNVANLFLRVAVTWFAAAVVLGVVMGMSGDRTMVPVHVHANLLGWVSMALFGVFYHLHPQAAALRAAAVHFWLYVPAHFIMMASLGALYRGAKQAEPILGVSSLVVLAGVLCFAVVVWRQTGTSRLQAPVADQERAVV